MAHTEAFDLDNIFIHLLHIASAGGLISDPGVSFGDGSEHVTITLSKEILGFMSFRQL